MRAQEFAARSDGAFDITVGPLVNLWGFGPDKRPREAPDVAAIAAAKARVGWAKIRLDDAGHRAFQAGGVYVDLSSVAKGFGVAVIPSFVALTDAELLMTPTRHIVSPILGDHDSECGSAPFVSGYIRSNVPTRF